MLLFRLRFITIILGRHRRRWVLPSFHHAPGRLSVHWFQTTTLPLRNIFISKLFRYIQYRWLCAKLQYAVANALETPQSLTKPSICVPRKCWKGPVSLITKHIYCQKLYLTNYGKLFIILFQNLSEIDKEVGSPRWLDFTKAHGLFSAIL